MTSPVGDFTLWFTPTAETEGCDEVFYPVPHSLNIAKQCGGAPVEDGRCDLGTISDCPPFEMPPMRPGRG